ncbi:MAG: hypothetical protein JWM95_4119 [Gemmatimonadetes bacterium]|nr:hypothetical protein [Gemmatimonadota bacterium]
MHARANGGRSDSLSGAALWSPVAPRGMSRLNTLSFDHVAIPAFSGRLIDRIRANSLFLSSWGRWRQRAFHRAYERRRDSYARAARERGLVYDDQSVPARVRARYSARGYVPSRRSPGTVHTLAFMPNIGWHQHLMPDLRELGPVSWFDYAALGYSWDEFARADRAAIVRRATMNAEFLAYVRRVHAEKAVDWIFVYAGGLELSAATLRRIREEFGIPLVGMCLDDKNSWEGAFMGDHRAGQVDIAAEFDIAWTSARVACEWYLVEGGCPLYLPEGFDRGAFRPMPVEPDIPASFVGSAYGFRPRIIGQVRERGVPLRVFGRGWPTGEFARDPVEIYNRSRINVGLGEAGYSETLTNVKGRDFEIPATGGGVYLTSYNADLAQHYTIGDEILCYRGVDELIEQLRYYLDHPELTRAMSARARARSLAEHRWLHRYRHICTLLGVLEPEAGAALTDLRL